MDVMNVIDKTCNAIRRKIAAFVNSISPKELVEIGEDTYYEESIIERDGRKYVLLRSIEDPSAIQVRRICEYYETVGVLNPRERLLNRPLPRKRLPRRLKEEHLLLRHILSLLTVRISHRHMATEYILLTEHIHFTQVLTGMCQAERLLRLHLPERLLQPAGTVHMDIDRKSVV